MDLQTRNEKIETIADTYDGKNSKYYLRIGNSTLELDARETMSHVTMR